MEDFVHTSAEGDLSTEKADFSHRIIYFYMLFLSVAFLIASLIGALVTDEKDFFENLATIITSPSKLITDYFALGGLGSAFFNAAICGFFANFLIAVVRTKCNATTLAAYLLVVAHCFYGLNILNMLPTILGVWIFCLATKRSISENIHIALFSTALGPFVSEFLFRYTLRGTEFNYENPQLSILGIFMSLAFGIIAGFVVPALIPETAKMHRGYNLYKAGLAIGILGIFIYSFLYDVLGFTAPEQFEINNPEYYALANGYRFFINAFFISVFLITGIGGFILNGRSLKGYGALLKSSGHGTDFLDKFGMPLCLVNIAVYGLLFVGFINLVTVLPDVFTFLPKSPGFTGATTGVIFAAITFTADGQHPRNVAPIVLGYVLLFVVMCASCLIFELDVPWTLSTQSYINGLAFATGLCPFAGRYGWRIGTLAGFLSAVICTATSAMHGGFVLYNGGFTAGLTALVLLPILDFYHKTPKYEGDE